jgi:hypothetical protein
VFQVLAAFLDAKAISSKMRMARASITPSGRYGSEQNAAYADLGGHIAIDSVTYMVGKRV